MVHLKFVRTADMPAACLPDKVPSEEGEPKAKPDSQSGTGEKSNGTPEGTRTPGPLLRRQLLYPPELWAHMSLSEHCSFIIA